MRCKRALCGVENECMVFELEDGMCVLINLKDNVRPLFNPLPQAFMRHMPYTDFAPAKELTQQTIKLGLEKVESLAGKYYDIDPAILARYHDMMLRDFPEE